MMDAINARLSALLDTVENPTLREAMRYAVLGEGKRIRPRLLLAACEAASGTYDETALDFACALEFIHAYSLAHDDLPAMDDDDLRRGKPTVHIQFDEATAILTGDALLNFAFETMANRCEQNPRLRRPVTAMSRIARAAGANGMVAGQVLDLQSEGKQIDRQTLQTIHHHKTGALFIAALEAGAILGGGTRTFIRHSAKLGELAGLLFQVRDDILDITSTPQALGKNPGSDEKNQKITYITLLGMEKTQTLYKELAQEVTALTHTLPAQTTTLRTLITQTIDREN